MSGKEGVTTSPPPYPYLIFPLLPHPLVPFPASLFPGYWLNGVLFFLASNCSVPSHARGANLKTVSIWEQETGHFLSGSLA